MVGLANFITFPYLVLTQGGAVFILAYAIAILTVVAPVWAIETAWG